MSSQSLELTAAIALPTRAQRKPGLHTFRSIAQDVQYTSAYGITTFSISQLHSLNEVLYK